MNLKNKIKALVNKEYMKIRYYDELGYYMFSTKFSDIETLIADEIVDYDKYYYIPLYNMIIDKEQFVQCLKNMMNVYGSVWSSTIMDNIYYNQYEVEMTLKYDHELHDILNNDFNIEIEQTSPNNHTCFTDREIVKQRAEAEQKLEDEVCNFISDLCNDYVTVEDETNNDNDIVIGITIQHNNQNIYIV